MGSFQDNIKIMEKEALDQKRIDTLFQAFVGQAQENCDEKGVFEYRFYASIDDLYHHLCEFEFLGEEWTHKNVGIELKREDSETISFKLIKGE